MRNFTLMILAAGFGRRMESLTKNIPKPILKINNSTLLTNTINFFENLGCKKFIINTHYLHENLKNYIDVKLETYPKEIIINDKNLVSSIKLNNGIIQNLDKTQIISTIPVIELIKCLKNIDK